MNRFLVCVAVFVIAGCGEGPSPTAPASVASEAGEQQIRTPSHDRPTEVEMVAAMEAHYSVVILAHDALIKGDLGTFRAQIALVPQQELPPSSPEEWLPLHEQLQSAAADASEVTNLDAAAPALASVVSACGNCHVALGSGPIYPAPSPDDGGTALQVAMLDHQWATERLWEGVTGPWDNAWQRGADALAEIEVFGDSSRDVELSQDLQRLEQDLRQIGEEAKRTTTLDARAALYGRLLATCGECHQAIGATLDESD